MISEKYTLAEFLHDHNAKKAVDQQRLGQRFVNFCIKEDLYDTRLHKLFYEEDEKVALKMIGIWLQENHYGNMMPQHLKK